MAPIHDWIRILMGSWMARLKSVPNDAKAGFKVLPLPLARNTLIKSENEYCKALVFYVEQLCRR